MLLKFEVWFCHAKKIICRFKLFNIELETFTTLWNAKHTNIENLLFVIVSNENKYKLIYYLNIPKAQKHHSYDIIWNTLKIQIYLDDVCCFKKFTYISKVLVYLHEIKWEHKVARWTCEILHPMRKFLRNIIPPYGTIICIKAHQKYIE